jgi:hypothetical protein
MQQTHTIRDTDYMVMDKTVRRIINPKEQQAETYRYWQSQPVGVRLCAVWEATVAAYAFKGIREEDFPSSRTIVRVDRRTGKPVTASTGGM